MSTVDLANISKEELAKALAEKEKAERLAKAKKRREFEQEKEAYVQEVVSQFSDLQTLLIDLKKEAVTQGNKIWHTMFALQDSEPKEQKQFSLTNEKKTLKVTVDRAERMGFSEEALVGIQGVKDYFYKKFASRSKEAYGFLDDILAKNGAGEYDPKLLAKLRTRVQKINDPELTNHFSIIEDNQVVTGTALYLRAAKKNEAGKWQDITLQFSSL